MSDRHRSSRSWDNVAEWYAGWSGPKGSYHHRQIAIPALMSLLAPKAGETVLDIGCGPGPLAPPITRQGAGYTGLDSSRKLIAIARANHKNASFVEGNAIDLAGAGLRGMGQFAAATFLLSIQDIDPLEAAIASAAQALKQEGRLVILMTHPCFRIPRQSGWGWDEGRKLRFRRVDGYLSRLDIPMQPHGRKIAGSTRSFHRPLGAYVAALSGNGFVIDALEEIAVPNGSASTPRAIARADREFPLFMGIRAVRSK